MLHLEAYFTELEVFQPVNFLQLQCSCDLALQLTKPLHTF
jgi:hypothetical protein